MGLQLSVAINVADTLRALDFQSRQLPFAVAKALTRTAQAVQTAQVREMQDVFDRPTPWTLRGVGYLPADKNDSPIRAFVFLKDRSAVSTGTPADVYLTPQIRGGGRDLKRFELAFRSAGVLPSSYYMVPGEGATIDRYGNMAHGQINMLISYFQAFRENGFLMNTTAEGRAKLAKGTKRTPGVAYFVVKPGESHLFPGIYRRTTTGTGKGRIMPIIAFVSSVHYEAIYPFEDVGRMTVEKEFPGQLAAATREASATAR